MLEKPDIADRQVIASLADAYGAEAHTLTFLPLGADRNTAVYRADTEESSLFVKLRSGLFDAASVVVPCWLHEHGIPQVMTALPNRDGQLWTQLGAFKLMVYPFIEGTDGFQRLLSAQHWVALGQALRAIHTSQLPPDLAHNIPQEQYAPLARNAVHTLLDALDFAAYDDTISMAFITIIQTHEADIRRLLDAAEQLVERLQAQPRPLILCHADIHVGNLLVDTSGQLHIVDWDTMLLAPRERDLMFMGMGLGSNALVSTREQARLFYEGYGNTDIDYEALAYYRCERIIQDVYEYATQLLQTSGDSADRREGLAQFRSQFEPHGVVEHALHTLTALD
jgi:spectinomycin phosphotransferase